MSRGRVRVDAAGEPAAAGAPPGTVASAAGTDPRGRSHPGYLALWSGRHLSPELARADEANNQLIAAGVQRVLSEHAGVADGPALGLAVQVAVRTADTLLQYAFSLSPGGDEAVLAELKNLLRLYLASRPAERGR